MSTIGLVHFDQQTGHGKGRLRTLMQKFDLTLAPVEGHDGDANKPVLNVFGDVGSDPVQIGSGWRKVGQRGRMVGEVFYSLTLDDPSMAAPMHVFLFPQARQPGGARPGPQDPLPFDVVWQRSRGGEEP